jgi:predicted homoserine dehydrogenase-like protein
MSVLAAAQLGCSSGALEVRPVVDLVAVADRDIEPGEVLAMGERHAVPGLSHELRPAQPLQEDSPLPYYLAAGGCVRRRVRRGEALLGGDIDVDSASVLLKLRRAQDAHCRPEEPGAAARAATRT